jgi:hypothetical protein
MDFDKYPSDRESMTTETQGLHKRIAEALDANGAGPFQSAKASQTMHRLGLRSLWSKGSREFSPGLRPKADALGQQPHSHAACKVARTWAVTEPNPILKRSLATFQAAFGLGRVYPGHRLRPRPWAVVCRPVGPGGSASSKTAMEGRRIGFLALGLRDIPDPARSSGRLVEDPVDRGGNGGLLQPALNRCRSFWARMRSRTAPGTSRPRASSTTSTARAAPSIRPCPTYFLAKSFWYS